MSPYKLIVCFVLIAATAAAKDCTSCCDGKGGNGNPDIDYVQLAVQSAKGFCEMKNCDTSFTGWSIHGLWPSQKGAMGPNSCNSTASFDVDAINAILNQMNKEWPTLLGADPTGFWCHEWCKHGTCAMAGLDDVISMISYFQTALELFAQTQMNEVFQQQGISSSQDSTYKLSDFQSLFSPSPAFECTHYNGGQLLFGARFCYTTDLQPVECNMDWFVSVRSCKEDEPIYFL